jgi:ATP-dependent Clp protease protease subunit
VTTPNGYPEVPHGGSGLADPRVWMARQLFDRRIVSLAGKLDDQAANEVGVALMTLDASGDDPVQLQIDSGDGTVAAGLALMDIIDLLGVPVRASCVGQVAGPAVGVLAVCSHRSVSPHIRLRLFEPAVEVQGHARQLEQLASVHIDRWTAFCTRVSEAAGQPVEQVREDAARGRFLSADDAVAYGLADEVASPDARLYRLPSRSLGFRPR